MSEYIINAQMREEIGKGPARRLRMNKRLPAVVYSKNQETLSISICPSEMQKAMFGPLRRNAILNVKFEGQDKNKTVMVKERQIHPVKRDLTHVDFVEIDMNKPVKVQVPLKLVGKSEAVVQGGKMEHVLHKVHVTCLPKDIPAKVDVDVTNLSFGSTHVSDIPLPKELTLAEKPRVVVLTIKKPRGAAAKEEETAAS